MRSAVLRLALYTSRATRANDVDNSKVFLVQPELSGDRVTFECTQYDHRPTVVQPFMPLAQIKAALLQRRNVRSLLCRNWPGCGCLRLLVHYHMRAYECRNQKRENQNG